ncbi:MAG TPA: hypothetical protein VGI19_12715 [Candidatus Cybelea sp.]|jgi:sugar lactone lactonase YvrE
MKGLGFFAAACCSATLLGGCGDTAIPAATSPSASSIFAQPRRDTSGMYLYVAGASLRQYAPGNSQPIHTALPKYGDFFGALTTDHAGRVIVVDSVSGVDIFDGQSLSLLKTVGASYPQSVAVDRYNDIYIANCGGAVDVYSSGGKKKLRGIGSGYGGCFVAADKRGDIYLTNGYGRVEVYAVEKPGSVTLLRTITKGVTNPDSFAFGPNGDVYILNYQLYSGSGNGSVSVYPAGSTSPKLTIERGIDLPFAIAVDSNGMLYVGNDPETWHRRDGWVSVYAPGSHKVMRRIRTGVNAPLALTTDSADNVYVGNAYGNDVTVHNASGKLIERMTGGVQDPATLAIGQ